MSEGTALSFPCFSRALQTRASCMMFTATQASCGSLEKGGGEKGGTSAERKGRNLCRGTRSTYAPTTTSTVVYITVAGNPNLCTLQLTVSTVVRNTLSHKRQYPRNNCPGTTSEAKRASSPLSVRELIPNSATSSFLVRSCVRVSPPCNDRFLLQCCSMSTEAVKTTIKDRSPDPPPPSHRP